MKGNLKWDEIGWPTSQCPRPGRSTEKKVAPYPPSQISTKEGERVELPIAGVDLTLSAWAVSFI